MNYVDAHIQRPVPLCTGKGQESECVCCVSYVGMYIQRQCACVNGRDQETECILYELCGCLYRDNVPVYMGRDQKYISSADLYYSISMPLGQGLSLNPILVSPRYADSQQTPVIHLSQLPSEEI